MYESDRREGEKMNLAPARDKSLSQRGGENKRTMKCISLRKRGRKTNREMHLLAANTLAGSLALKRSKKTKLSKAELNALAGLHDLSTRKVGFGTH